MFDRYKPAPTLACPACGAPLLKWQGKGGPCVLFLWEQGGKGPSDQLIDEDLRLAVDERATWRLPATFRIRASCRCGLTVRAEGRCDGEVWTQTRLLDA